MSHDEVIAKIEELEAETNDSRLGDVFRSIVAWVDEEISSATEGLVEQTQLNETEQSLKNEIESVERRLSGHNPMEE